MLSARRINWQQKERKQVQIDPMTPCKGWKVWMLLALSQHDIVGSFNVHAW